jgi:hypothetical protein
MTKLLARVRARTGLRSQAGNSLLLALLFIGSIGFLCAVSLDYAFATLSQGASNRDAQVARYGAFGAVDLMVEAMRQDNTWGRDGSACNDVQLPVAGGRTARAVCTPLSGSGALLTDGSGARANRVVDVIASVDGIPLVHARITINDGSGSVPAASVALREVSSAL